MIGPRSAVVAALVVMAGAIPAMAAPPSEAVLSTLSAVLQDGYEVRSAFSDNNGGAYVVLQKGTSAYMCHSNPSPRCEKLN